jgi:hypothetical protein
MLLSVNELGKRPTFSFASAAWQSGVASAIVVAAALCVD